MDRLSGILPTLLGSVLLSQPSFAADRNDCLGNIPEKIVAGCTTVIDDAGQSTTNRAIAYYNRGTIRSAMGQWDKAIGDFDKSINLNSRNGGAFFNRALTYKAMGDLPRAIVDYTSAIGLKPARFG